MSPDNEPFSGLTQQNVAKAIHHYIHNTPHLPVASEALGYKADKEKSLAGVLIDFSRALEEVAEVGTFGARKYARANWLKVEDAEQRYYDAMWRHLLASGRELNDPESGMDHLAHAAWNILAVIELQQRKESK